jgi:hypothetical protein
VKQPRLDADLCEADLRSFQNDQTSNPAIIERKYNSCCFRQELMEHRKMPAFAALRCRIFDASGGRRNRRPADEDVLDSR